MEPLTPASLQGRVPQSCSGCCQQFHCKHFGTRCGHRPALGAHSATGKRPPERQAQGMEGGQRWRQRRYLEQRLCRGHQGLQTRSDRAALCCAGAVSGPEGGCPALEGWSGRSQTQVPVPRRKPQDQPPAAPVHGEDAAEALSWPPGRGLGQWPSGQHTQLCGCWFSTLLFYVI